MGILGQHLDDRQRQGSVILPASVVANRADGDVNVRIRHTGEVVRASRGNTGGTYKVGQVVQVSRTDASGVTSNTGWVIIGPPPSSMKGSSASAPLSETATQSGTAVTLIVPNPVPLVAGGDSVEVNLYGAFASVDGASFGSGDISNAEPPTGTSTQITLQVEASGSAVLGDYDLLLDGAVVAPGLFQVSAAEVPPAEGDYLFFLAREVVGDHTEPRIVVVDSVSLEHITTITPDPDETELIDLAVVRNSSGVDEAAHEWLMVRGKTSLYAIRSTDLVVFASFTGLPSVSAPHTIYPVSDFPGQTVPAASVQHVGDAALLGSSQVGGEGGTLTWPGMAGAGPYGVAVNYDPGSVDPDTGIFEIGSPFFGVDGVNLYQMKADGSANLSTLAIADAHVVTMSRGYAWVGAGNFVHKVLPFFFGAPMAEVAASADLGAAFDGTQLRTFPTLPAYDSGQLVYGCVGSGGGADSKVFVLDDATLAITSVAVPQGPHGLAYGPELGDNRKLYACDDAGGITIIDPETMTIETRLVCWPSTITRLCYVRRAAI